MSRPAPRPAHRAVRRFQCAACFFALTLILSACVTGSTPPRPAGPSGFGVTSTELIGAVSLDRFSQTLAEQEAQQKTPASGREAAPIQVAAATVVTDGVGSFTRFRNNFLTAVAQDQRNEYLDHILFPLRLVDYRRSGGNGRTVSTSRFNADLIYDANTLRRTGAPPLPLGDTFTGVGSEAMYWGDRLLVFRPVEGRWMLTEAGSCENTDCKPADLLCQGFDARRAYPGRTPQGFEDFDAFYRAFYCMSHDLTGAVEATPISSAYISRIQFPLATYRPMPEGGVVEPVALGIDEFQPSMLFPGRRGVPSTIVDGAHALAIVGADAGHQVAAVFTRIDGRWFLTGLLG